MIGEPAPASHADVSQITESDEQPMAQDNSGQMQEMQGHEEAQEDLETSDMSFFSTDQSEGSAFAGWGLDSPFAGSGTPTTTHQASFDFGGFSFGEKPAESPKGQSGSFF
jgi:hypothetical protein